MANTRPIKYETNEQGCHLVVSHKLNQDGYFRKMTKEGKAIMWHRKVYEDIHGTIPVGYEVDHMCRHRHCINPEHLQLLTIEEHKAKTNRERSDDKRVPAKAYWESTGCTGTALAAKFGVSFSSGCKWIKQWTRERAETIQ
jgi:hypothetical protein